MSASQAERSYLCYDVRGIQSYVFAIPMLKAIVGGSSMIDRFDKNVREYASTTKGLHHIFAGGGHGAIECDDQVDADALETKLVAWAKEDGLDLQIGVNADIVQAVRHADQFYVYCPETLDGFPCPASGLFPVVQTDSKEPQPHEKILRRVRLGWEDPLGQTILDQLLGSIELPDEYADCGMKFFRNVNPEPIGEPEENISLDEQYALAAKAALGWRNRWAVISMDVNDAGRQIKPFLAAGRDVVQEWLRVMSNEMDRCTRSSFLHALSVAINDWLTGNSDRLGDFIVHTTDQRYLVLPFRPLILAGDQLTLITHCDHAIDFVTTMAKRFAEEAVESTKTWTQGQLWPASNNVLTISAGVLFSKVTVPLHILIPYADSLLGSAKGAFRETGDTATPTPAAIDFEVVTDTMLDAPADRRRREFCFRDPDLNGAEISLTQRPYRLEGSAYNSWQSLQELKDQLGVLPLSVRSQLLGMFRSPWSERTEFLLSIAKRYPHLSEMFLQCTPDDDTPRGWSRDPHENRLQTGLADAILLLGEEHRINQGDFTLF